MFHNKIHAAIVSVFFMLLLSSALFAQLPKSSVYIASLKEIQGKTYIEGLSYLTQFNPNGYNNQPRFFGPDELYVTVGFPQDSITEIYSLQLKTNKYKAVTNTETISEFSPTPSPNGTHYSTVRIEEDGKTQSLWLSPKDGSNQGKRLLSGLSNVGYHCWVGKDTVALFLVGKVNTLSIANIKTGKFNIVAENIGRCLRSIKANTVIFVQKSASGANTLSAYNTIEKTTKTIATMPPEREDFEWVSKGFYITGDGSKILALDQSNNKWDKIADLSKVGITNINRIHSHGDRIVFVNTPQ